MDSFGLWYKSNESYSKEVPSVDLHINLWNIENKENKKLEPFLDFGFRIKNFRNIEFIDMLVPFELIDDDIHDLSCKVKERETAHLIFNDNYCEIASCKEHFELKDTEDKTNVLIINLNQSTSNNETHHKMYEITTDSLSRYSIIKIHLNKLADDIDYKDFDCIYIRFRILSDKLKSILFCKLKKKNLFLESGFTSTQIIDLKINKMRNIPYTVCKNYKSKSINFLNFKKIHFLIMEYADDDLLALGDDIVKCRTLEQTGWEDYLNKEYNTDDVLVYHWTKKADTDQPLTEYTKLVKISLADTNIKIILSYIGIVILLGAFGSLFAEFLKPPFLFIIGGLTLIKGKILEIF